MNQSTRESEIVKAQQGEESTECKFVKRVNASAQGPLSTHVLDTSKGTPASGLSISLYKDINDAWIFVKESVTQENGRCTDLTTSEQFLTGRYKIQFKVEKYFRDNGAETMFPVIEIIFNVKNATEHYHVPLLLSPFGYTTYRGS